MSDREKLVELIINAKKSDPETGSFTEYLADFLIGYGVIVLPCKVGDTVYEIDERYTKCTPYGERFSAYACAWCEKSCDSRKEYYIREVEITNIHRIFNMWDDFGKTWFTDHEVAKKALKAR